MRRWWAAAAIFALGCGGPAATPAPVERSFHLAPLTDLVAAPRLAWMIHVSPRTLYAEPLFAKAAEELLDAATLARFVRTHGGLDPRGLHEVVYARFAGKPTESADGELWAGRGFLPGRVEQAELQALPYVRQHAREPGGLVRIEGRAANHAVDLLLFGHQGIVYADNAPLAAKVARAFAEERLQRTKPALRGELEEITRALGEAPVRVFVARPDQSFARDGLLEHFEALACAFTPNVREGVLWIELRVLGTGTFASREDEVRAAVEARAQRLGRSRFGRMLGFTQDTRWEIETTPRTVQARTTIRGDRLLHGLHLATAASTSELFE